MKKYILLGGLLLLSLSACGTERPAERAKVGQIGAENSVSREMAAKTIALAFYTNQELDEMETKLNFSDLSGLGVSLYSGLCGAGLFRRQ